MALQHPRNYNDMAKEDLIALAQQYDAEAEKAKTARLNMRVSPRMLREARRAAAQHGQSKYQKWVESVIWEAIAQTFPDEYADPGDDF